MVFLGEFVKFMVFFGFIYGFCYFSYLERRESIFVEVFGMLVFGNFVEVRSGEEVVYWEILDYFICFVVVVLG